jgi:tetratricopeptide (TPR) repeat protein
MRLHARLAVIFLFASSLAAQPVLSPSELFERARQAEAGGQLQEALNAYNSAIESEDHWQFRLYRGLLYLRLRSSDLAAVDFTFVVQQLPGGSPDQLYFRALALSNEVLALRNIRQNLHPDLDNLEEVIRIAHDLINSATIDTKYLSAAHHLIGTTLVLEAEVLSEQNQAVVALEKLQNALMELPKSDVHWRAEALTLAGKILEEGPAWKEGVAFLRQAVNETERSHDVSELAQALSVLAHAERSFEKRTKALQRLVRLSFAGEPAEDYWNAWKAVQLAGYYLAYLQDGDAAKVEVERVKRNNWIAKYPELAFDFLFARANVAMLHEDRKEVAAAKFEGEQFLGKVPPSSMQYLDISTLLMRLAAATGDVKRALSLG